MRRVHSIVIHHTAGSQYTTAAEIDRRHRLLNWNGIGYHFLIRRDDSTYGWGVEKGRDVNKKGAHAGRGFPGNLGSIGVAVAGNYVKEAPPLEALHMLTGVVRSLRGLYGSIPIWGHCDLNATACPGRKLYDWLPKVSEYADMFSLPDEYFAVVPEPRKLAVDREEARYLFKLRAPWAKGIGA